MKTTREIKKKEDYKILHIEVPYGYYPYVFETRIEVTPKRDKNILYIYCRKSKVYKHISFKRT